MAKKNKLDIAKQIEALEEKIKSSKQELALLRRKAPPTPVEDYLLKDSFGNSVKLSSLFGEKNELIVVHNMGMSCPSCTTWADGFNGVLKHLEDRASFVVESPETPAKQRQFAADRGWGFRMVSSKGTTFRHEMGYSDEKNSPWPGVSAFIKDENGKILRVADAGFGPGDNFCIVWDFCDLLPGGWKDWDCKHHYSKVR